MNFNRPELFFAAFVGLWIGVSLSVARLGGWQRLQLSIVSQDFITAIAGDSRVENCGERWADISVTPGKRGFLSIYTEFRFRQAPMIPFRVNERLTQRILESAGNSWPGDREVETIPAISKC